MNALSRARQVATQTVEQTATQKAEGPLTVADIDAVMAVETVVYAFPWTRGNFIDSIAAGYWSWQRHDADGRLIGYAVAMHALDETHLLNLTVAPAVQGRGHGRALLDQLGRECRARGQRSLWLEVRRSNEAARRLYRRRGFAEVGERKAYYPAALGQREDAIVMSLDLLPEAVHGLE